MVAVPTAPAPSAMPIAAAMASPPAASATPTPPDSAEPNLAAIVARWGELPGQALRAGMPLVAAALADSRPLELTANGLVLDVAAEHVRRGTLGERGEFAAPLAKLIASLAGRPLRLLLRERAGGPTVAARLGETPADAEERALRYRAAQDDPVVKELLKRFDADIVAREPGDRQAWEDRLG